MKTRHTHRLHRPLLAAAIFALVLTLVSATAFASPTPPSSTTTVTLPVGEKVVQPKSPAPRSALSGLDSTLAQVVAAYKAGDRAALATFGDPNIMVAQDAARVMLQMAVDPEAHALGGPTYTTVALPGGRLVNVEHAPQIAIRPDLSAAIVAAGAIYETAYNDLVQVLAPFGSLEALAQIDGVSIVRLPFPTRPDTVSLKEAMAGVGPLVGAQTTQGVALTSINTYHSLGYDGTGVNLAIFDFGFTGWASLVASGDLPGGVVTHDFSAAYSFSPDTSGYAHGAACSEIAYDMAPAATVHLYAWSTEAELGNAVNNYIAVAGKKVATMSVSFVNAGPYDGTGSVNTIVDNAQAAGILWANSAGNYQKQHYSGTATQYSTTDAVAFGAGNIEGIGPTSGSLWNIASGTNLRIFLEWNDWNAARTGNQNHVDYDVELYRYDSGTSSWVYIGGAYNAQCTTTVSPVESLSYTVPSGGPYNYGIVIWRYQQTGTCTNNFGHWLNLFTFNGFRQTGTGAVNAFWYVNECNSLTIPADSSSAVTAGATYHGEDTLSPLFGLETFTSQGPRNASGGGNPGTVVNKPDVVAPDGVNTVTYGVNSGNYASATVTGFFGTSASAPHVAGLAASVWENRPTDTTAQLRTYIQTQALYKASGGTCGGARTPESGTQNNRYGWGRIAVGPPLAAVLSSFTAELYPGFVHLAWETVSEVNNTGFNVYRSLSEGGERTLLAFVPSPSPGSTAGASYVYDDSAVTAGQTYFYWVESVDVNGATTLFGPASITYTVPTAVTMGLVQASPAAAASVAPWAGTLLALLAPLVLAAGARRRNE